MEEREYLTNKINDLYSKSDVKTKNCFLSYLIELSNVNILEKLLNFMENLS